MIRMHRLALISALALSCLAGAALAAGGGGGGGSGGSDMGSSGPQYDPVAEYQKGIAAIQASKFATPSAPSAG